MISPLPSAQRKRIALVGSGGRLGGLMATALEKDHCVTRLARDRLDLGCTRSIAGALEPLDYDLLVIAGALTGVDYCESNAGEAFAINADGPGQIARISASKGAHVTYISTDFVYEGSKLELYSEIDRPDPISVYGASKARGEELVLSASPGNLVVRVSWLFGPSKPAFPEWIIDRACAVSKLALPANKIGCPTSSVDLVGLMMPLLFGRDGGGASGIFNLCNSRPCSWREWGEFCVQTARDAGLPVLAREIEGVPLESVAAFVARRPVNSAMSTDKFTAYTGLTPRCWQEAVRDFLLQSELFQRHRQVLANA